MPRGGPPTWPFALPRWLGRAGVTVVVGACVLCGLSALSDWQINRRAALEVQRINREIARGKVTPERAHTLSDQIALSLHTLILRHRRQTGNLPARLDELVSHRIIAGLPLNPYTTKPLAEGDLFTDAPGDYTYFVSPPNPPAGQIQTFILLIHGVADETIEQATGWGVDRSCFPATLCISHVDGNCDLAGKTSGAQGEFETLPTAWLLQQSGVPMTSDGVVKRP